MKGRERTPDCPVTKRPEIIRITDNSAQRQLGPVKSRFKTPRSLFLRISRSKLGQLGPGIVRRRSRTCYVPGVTRKELGNQIMTNYYSQESQQQALLKFNNLLRNFKIINYQKQWKICTIKESLVYSTLILSPNCPSELTHTNPSTVSDPQISKSY